MQAKNVLLIGAAFAAGYSLKNLNTHKEIELGNFIDGAIALGVAEIENAKVALEKSSSTNIKIFAQRMIDDHAFINQQLREIAKENRIPEPDSEHIKTIAKPYLIEFKSDSSFDEDYVHHQLTSHKNMIRLLHMIGRANDENLRLFYSKILNYLDSHLKMAQTLADTFHSNAIYTSSPLPADDKTENQTSPATSYVEEPDYKTKTLKQH